MTLFEKQIHHYSATTLLVCVVYALADDAALSGQLLGVSTTGWLWLAIAIPIVHQLYVWFAWRSQLKYSLLSQIFGESGFIVYAIGFTALIVSRPLVLVLLAVSNKNSIPLNLAFAYTLSFIFTLVSGYVFYSVRTYFGFKRAYGIDHFDESYRHLPFVREGIFRFTSNAMYTFGFLILWVPGLIFFSKAALIAAAFSHIYIWVHYYTTELPDIRFIYGDAGSRRQT